MKIYNTQKEIDADIVNGVLYHHGHIEITFDCVIEADINVGYINAWNINARDINAANINAGNINAGNINAGDIKAGNIKAGNINARDIDVAIIKAWDIRARDIRARGIIAVDISYYAFCIAYDTLKCRSIEGRRKNAIHKSLHSEIEFIGEHNDK